MGECGLEGVGLWQHPDEPARRRSAYEIERRQGRAKTRTALDVTLRTSLFWIPVTAICLPEASGVLQGCQVAAYSSRQSTRSPQTMTA
ncbi:hypothetical protein [Rhodococcus globerulus]|uniref:Transposase n=1 Tax=Rhodococcus globerulus TaxID=33008 RepID=A0ABU4BMR9_RHOGO|nr:hypothetical protein [Rhodococcus globerulus]MDV6265495.1 hypothetical protein [Rhodococcus globerulus]